MDDTRLSATQHGIVQERTAQHTIAQHSTAQHSTAQHRTAQHGTARHRTAQQINSTEKARDALVVERPGRHKVRVEHSYMHMKITVKQQLSLT